MKLTEVTATGSINILNESWNTLTEAQQDYMFKSERELWPLMEQLVKVFEAELTAAQIKQIFAGAEETAMASGNNKSALGKVGSAAKLPVDIMKAVNKKIDELGRLAQKTGPVQNADNKVEQLKKKITAENPSLASKITAVSDWVKANPGKASIGIAILTAAAAFAAGPAGGAAVGFLLRSTKEMLKGEKLSTAVGKAGKTAAVGALAGMTFDAIGDAVVDNIAAAGEADIDAMEDAMKAANVEDAMAEIDPQLQKVIPELEDAQRLSMQGSVNNFFFDYDVIMSPEQVAKYEQLKDAINGAEPFSDEYYKATAEFHDFMAGVANDPEQIQLKKAVEAIKAAQESSELSIEQLDQLIDQEIELADKVEALANADETVAAAVQGAAQAAEKEQEQAVKASAPKEPKQGELDLSQRGDTPVNKNFNKNQKLSAFGKVGDQAESIDMQARFAQYIAEADPAQGELPLDNPNTLGAKLKRGVKKVAGKAGAAVKQGAKDLGNKVTANKLMKAWKAAGSPTDTGSIVNILSGAGLSNDQIASIGQSANVELKPTSANAGAGLDLQSLADEIKKAGVAAQVKQMLMQG